MQLFDDTDNRYLSLIGCNPTKKFIELAQAPSYEDETILFKLKGNVYLYTQSHTFEGGGVVTFLYKITASGFELIYEDFIECD